MSHEEVKSEIEAWFSEYVRTFIRCARTPGADLEPLRSYFGVPLSAATDALFLSGETWEQVSGILGYEMAQLAKADYGDSRALDIDVRVINLRAATMAVTWSRLNRSGAEFQRVRVSYWLAKTEHGWRFLALAPHGS